jgi:hypothetical protein
MNELQEMAERKRTINELLATHRDRLFDLWMVAAAFFRAESEGKTYKRRPALSITIPSEGHPPARLSVFPRWDRMAMRPDTSCILAELLVERISIIGQTHRSTEVGLTLKVGSAWWHRISTRWGIESLRRLVATADAFLNNPQTSFAQSGDHCCMCRKALVDGQSRARGIGPECFRRANLLRELVEEVLAKRQTV